MNIRDLHYLVALADQRNFRRAAAVCNVSQPTLSTQIKKLEDELGVTLIERMPRNVILTPAGVDTVERARRILAELDELKLAARTRQEGRDKLRLGVFPTLGPYLLPHIIQPVMERFPGLELLLTEEKSGVLRQQLASGTLDAALLADPTDDEHLAHLPLFEEPFLLAVPRTHALANQTLVEPGDLVGQKLMVLEEGHCLRDQVLAASRQSGAVEESTFRGTSLETLRQMVVAGAGVTFLPALACSSGIVDGGYRVLPFRDGVFQRTVSLHWRKTSPIADLIREVGTVIGQNAGAILGAR